MNLEAKVRLVRHRLLSAENGRAFPGLEVVVGHDSAPKVDEARGVLVFGTRVGPSNDVSGVTHELGHLMCVSDERIGEPAWGFCNPYWLMDAFGGGSVAPRGKLRETNMEAKAWAWQHILEVAAGLRSDDDLATHPEAQFLDDQFGSVSAAAAAKAAEPMVLQHLAAIRTSHTDPVASFKARLRRLPDILAENIRFASADLGAKVSEKRFENTEGGEEVVVLLVTEWESGLHEVTLVMEHAGETGAVHQVVTTRSPERAARIAEIVAEVNEMTLVPALTAGCEAASLSP